MTLVVGLVGAGYWGERLFRVFAALPDVTVAMVADPDIERQERFRDHTAVSGDGASVWHHPGIDAVIVATPPSTHYDLARRCLAAGKHCWVEKPLALSTGDARTLVDLARVNDRALFVDETFLYDPLVRRARTWIRDGLLGDLLHVSCERLSLGRVRRDSDIWWNAAPHDLSLINYLIPAAVSNIRVERFSHLQPGVADACAATIRLEGGISAHLYLSWLSPLKRAGLVVVGSKGMIAYEGRFAQRALSRYDYLLADPRLVSGTVVPINSFTAAETFAGGQEEPLALAAAAFVDRILNGTPGPSEGAESLKIVELLERGDRSTSDPRR